MCLAIPGRVVGISEAAEGRLATVDFGDAERLVDLAFVPEAVVGDWLIVHSGLAVRRLAGGEAAATTDMWRTLES